MLKNLKNFIAIVLVLALVVIVFIKFFLTSSYQTKYQLNYETSLIAMSFVFSERDGKELKSFYRNLPKDLKKEDVILEKYLTYLVRLAEFEEASLVSNMVVKNTNSVELANNIVFLEQLKQLDRQSAIEFLANNKTEGHIINFFSSLFSAWYFIQEGDEKSAFSVLKSDDSDGFFYRHFARAFYAKGEKQKALEMFEKTNPKNEVLSYALIFEYINLLIENGKEQKALDVYSRYFENSVGIDFLREKSKDFKIVNVNQSVSDVLLQISYVASGFDYNTGLQFVYYALMLNEENAGARTHLASLALNMYNDKKLAYKLVKNQDLNNVVYYDFFTRNFNAFKDIDGTSYEKILLNIYKSFPENYSILVDLAYLYIADNNYRKAINVLSYIQNNAPLENDKQVSWYLEFYKAIICAKVKDIQNAKVHFEKAKLIDDKNPVMLNYYAYTLIENNTDIDYALSMLEQALSLSKAPEILDSYAWGLFKQGNYDKAKLALEEALVGMPYSVEVNEHIGDVYWQLGRKQIAIYHWQEALRISLEMKDKSNNLSYKNYKDEKSLRNKVNGILPNYLDENVVDKNKQEYKDFILHYKSNA